MALKDLCQSGEDNVSKSPQRCIMNSYDQCNGIKRPYFERSQHHDELEVRPFWQGLICFSPLLKSSTMRLGSSNHREYFKSSNSHRGDPKYPSPTSSITQDSAANERSPAQTGHREYLCNSKSSASLFRREHVAYYRGTKSQRGSEKPTDKSPQF